MVLFVVGFDAGLKVHTIQNIKVIHLGVKLMPTYVVDSQLTDSYISENI